MGTSFDPSIPLHLLETHVLGVFAGVAGRVTDANDAWLGIVGYTRDDLESGRIDWRALTPPALMARDLQASAEADAHGWVRPYFKQYVRPDGTTVDVMIMSGRAPSAIRRWVAVAIDVTHLLRVTPLPPSADTSGQFDAVLEACPWPATYLRRDGSWCSPNSAMRELFGIAAGTEPTRWEDRCRVEDRDAVGAACARVLTGTMAQLVTDVVAVARDGVRRRCRVHLSRLFPSPDESRSAVCYVSDVDAERTTRDRVVQAEAIQEALLRWVPGVTLVELDRNLECVTVTGAQDASITTHFHDLSALPTDLQHLLADARDGLDGTWRGVIGATAASATISPLRDANGAVTGAAILLEPVPQSS